MTSLPTDIQEMLKRRALGQVLSSWGDLTYEQVLESLYETGQTWNDNDDISVWHALSDNYAEYIAEHIEDVHATFVDSAEAVADAVLQSVIQSVERILQERSGQPASQAMRLLLEDLGLRGEPSDG